MISLARQAQWVPCLKASTEIPKHHPIDPQLATLACLQGGNSLLGRNQFSHHSWSVLNYVYYTL
jgi:hypothetical protein